MSIETRSSRYNTLFGNWHIDKLLGTGSGGKSAVYSLYRDNDGWQEYSAMKVVSLIEERGFRNDLPSFLKDEYTTAMRRQQEAAATEVLLMNQLRGKTNIVDYLDHQFCQWEENGAFGLDLVIRMELLTDLRSELIKGRFFTEQEIIRIGQDICQALVICHEKGILHRDIKPENIFFNADGDYKLGDFGISRTMSQNPSLRASTSIGTAAYISPEQNSGAYDHRVDIYSLGLVLYELANGNHLPFAQSIYITEAQVQTRLAGTPLPAPCRSRSENSYQTVPAAHKQNSLSDIATVPISSELSRIILKACAFRPEDRYLSAGEMLQDLNALLTHQTIPAVHSPYQTIPAAPPVYPQIKPTVQTPAVPPQAPKQKSNVPAILTSTVLLAAAIFFALYFFPHRHTWIEATCTAPKTCEKCAETSGSPLDHAWIAATCAEPKICHVCSQTEGIAAGHVWSEGSCTTAATCIICGHSQDAPAGHQWRTASCIELQTCTVCGTTEGSALGHILSPATCTTAEHCTRCSQQSGTALGHLWVDATFHTPMTCSRCSETSGEPRSYSHISIEDEVMSIKEHFNKYSTMRINNELDYIVLPNNASKYFDEYRSMVLVLIPRGTEGLGEYSSEYARWYCYRDGKLIFAYFEGQRDSHRLYFYDELLMRWRYRLAGGHPYDDQFSDFTFTSEYLMLEKLALEEAATFK